MAISSGVKSRLIVREDCILEDRRRGCWIICSELTEEPPILPPSEPSDGLVRLARRLNFSFSNLQTPINKKKTKIYS